MNHYITHILNIQVIQSLEDRHLEQHMHKILANDDKQDNLISLKASLKNYLPEHQVFTARLEQKDWRLPVINKADLRIEEKI